MNLIELETVDSTNSYAKDQAKAGAVSGTVIWAHKQTLGRGRQGNQWVSSSGNLFMSLIIRPEVSSQDIWQLSFLTSVALYNVLEKITPQDIKIELKWPNDLLINSKKLSGILLETESGADWVVIGIGLNITSAPDGAVCLNDIGLIDITAKDIMELVASEIENLVVKWQKDGFAFIRDIWLKNAYKLGEQITANLPQGPINGLFKGIDENGCLQLLMNDGSIKSINSGEVFL